MLDMDPQIVHGTVRIFAINIAFTFTAVYGLHNIKNRERLWMKLKAFETTQQGP